MIVLDVRAVLRMIGLAAALLSAVASWAATDLGRMRALHFTGNWGGNIAGIRTAVSSPISSAPAITASQVEINVVRGSFVDNGGVTRTNDNGAVRLTGVNLGGVSLPQAVFWIGRDTTTQAAFLQFIPSIEPSLAAIPGFSGDITMTIMPDGAIDGNTLSLVTGEARDYVLAILAHGGDLVHGASFSSQAGATFSEEDIESVLRGVTAALLREQTEYWDFLKAENVQWIGISVAIFGGALDDPTVRVKYRPAGVLTYDVYTFDDADLRAFIAKAKRLGFKVYLTLAFEPSNLNFPPPTNDPTCNTGRYVVNRAFLGQAHIVTGDPNQACLNPSVWWWDPAHPSHAANVAQFWASYTQVALKYASLCQDTGVDLFSLGTESDWLFRTEPSPNQPNDFRTELAAMVAAVRAAYSGLVTYDQLMSVTQHPEWFDGAAGQVALFQDLGLDAVGVSAYFQLAQNAPGRVLAVPELEALWEDIFQNDLAPLQARNSGRPIVFTEFGYTDDVNSPWNPGANAQTSEPGASTPGMQQQQNILEAFFNVDDRHGGLVKGGFLWGNGVFSAYPADCNQVGYNIHCKPSAQTVSSVYARWDHPYQGLWWNPSESGWGMSVTQHGNIAFVAIYAYDANGQPIWYVVSDCPVSGSGCSGTLYKVAGGTPPTMPWNGGALTLTPVGSATLAFAADANSGMLTLAINGANASKAIVRQTFGIVPVGPAVDHTDVWWTASESGWGIALTEQSPNIFAAWYTYDASGQPKWYFASNCLISGGGCAGELYQATGGSPLTMPWTASLVTAKVGTIGIAFQDAFNASLTYTINGVTSTRAIARQPF